MADSASRRAVVGSGASRSGRVAPEALRSRGSTIQSPPGIRNATEGRVVYLAYLRDPTGNKLCAYLRLN